MNALNPITTARCSASTGERGEILVDKHMRTSVPNVYAIGDLIGPPMEIFKARRSGVTAARNIMGEEAEFDWTDYPDFLHSTYEMTWVGLSEQEARERYDNVTVIQMPPKGVPFGDIPLPCAEGTMLYAFQFPELSGFQKRSSMATRAGCSAFTTSASEPRTLFSTSIT